MDAKKAVQSAIYGAEKWDRSSYVGASEIGGCPLKIYYEKTEDSGFRGNGKTVRGHAIESALIALLKRGGMDIRFYDNGHTNRQKEIKHPVYPVIVHPDGIIYKSHERPHAKIEGKTVKESFEDAILEVKSVGTDAFRNLKEPAPGWVVQSRFNAFMVGVPRALLVAVDASDFENIIDWTFEAMTAEEADAYLEKAKRIMAAKEIGVEPIAEPTSDNCKWCDWKERCERRWIPDEEAKAAEAEAPEIEDYIAKMNRAKELKDEAKTLESEARPAILQAAQAHNAARLTAGGFRVIVESRKGRMTLDTKRMLADHPEIDRAQYEKQGAASIALKIKEM
jgi:hypothetical protein